jgi:opacity protein-like surface antigen
MKAIVLSVAAAALCLSAPAQAQVNTSQNGVYGQVTLNSGFQPDPHSVTLTAGGDVEASSVSPDCVGMIARRADFTLRYRQAGELPLILSATSDADTTLAVRAPDGRWYCNDDTNGLNPMVRFDAPRNGRYQIWVGTFGAETAPAMLHISEISAAGGVAGGQPDFSLDPAYGAIGLASGYTPDPHTIAIQAGGELDASVLGGSCIGWIARAPDYRVNWSAGSGSLPLIISVAAEADTTLVINDAQGNWVCDDDGGNDGFNPAITFTNPASGQYDIWVGTYAQGPLQPSTLHVSELYSQ